jgi:hypothetical protein
MAGIALSRRGPPTVMTEEASETSAFACCSVGIGRWFWVVWESESAARALEPALATGYEKSAARAGEQAAERVGGRPKQLPARWASGYKGRGSSARTTGTGREDGEDAGTKPRARIGRPRRDAGPTRLAFLYAATERDDTPGGVAVARHRIVKQTAAKIHVDCEPFDEEEWRRRAQLAEESPADTPKTRTLAVDRATLRKEGRFRCRDAYREVTFYASEEDGIRDVEADLTERHAWCAALGVRFPCSADSIRSAYRGLARALHPDAGGDPAEFRAVEQAYREALAYFAQADDPTA